MNDNKAPPLTAQDFWMALLEDPEFKEDTINKVVAEAVELLVKENFMGVKGYEIITTDDYNDQCQVYNLDDYRHLKSN